MALRFGRNAQSFVGTSAVAIIPSYADQQTEILMAVFLLSEAGNYTITSPGFSLINSITEGLSTVIAYRRSRTTLNQAAEARVEFRNASNVLISAKGAIGFDASDYEYVKQGGLFNSAFVNNHVTPALTGALAGDYYYSLVASRQFPRTWATTDVTEEFDVTESGGPGMAFGQSLRPSDGTTPQAIWVASDFWDPGAAGTEQYGGIAFLMREAAVAAEPTLSGGGSVAIIAADRISITAPASAAIDESVTVSAILTGTDNLPIEGAEMTLTGAMAVSGTPATTDASGRAFFLVSATNAGVKSLVATSFDVSTSFSITVAGSSITVGATPDSILEGQTFMVSGVARQDGGAAITDETVTLKVEGVSWSGNTTTQTNSNGGYAFSVTATSVGTARVSVSTANSDSDEVSVQVRAPEVIVIGDTRLRSIDYPRPRARNR